MMKNTFEKFLYYIVLVKDLLWEKSQVREFDQRLKSYPPVLIFSHTKIQRPVREYITSHVRGVVLESDNLNANHPDWRIRRLYRHCLVKKHPVHIISLVSEPVSENVFQFLSHCSSFATTNTPPSIEKLDELTSEFLSKYNHELVINWFDKVLEPVLKINVYKGPFAVDGHAIFLRNNIKLLLLRNDKEQQNLNSHIADFLNIPEISLSPVLSDEENGALTWEVALKNIILPYAYIQKLCSSHYFKHFFTDETKGHIIKKWCNFNSVQRSDAIITAVNQVNYPFPNVVRHDIARYRFWFIDIPRTSSSSIKVELGNKFGVAFGKSRLIEENHAQVQILSNHIPARVMRKMIGAQLWENIFKFTIVRNPWDRTVSMYHYRRKTDSIPAGMSFNQYVKELARSRGQGLFKYHGFYLSNADYISGENNEILVDYIGKYETRDADLKFISERIGFQELGKIHLQSANDDNSHYSRFYTRETMEIVREIYAKDIELFSYTFAEGF